MRTNTVIASVEVPLDLVRQMCAVADNAPTLPMAVENLVGRLSDLEHDFEAEIMPLLYDDISRLRVSAILTIPEWMFVIENLMENTYGLLKIDDDNVDQFGRMDFQRALQEPSILLRVTARQRWISLEGQRRAVPDEYPVYDIAKLEDAVVMPLTENAPYVPAYEVWQYQRIALNAATVIEGLGSYNQSHVAGVVNGLQQLVREGRGWERKD